MQQSLSPKRYIETKARSLPVYKCLVNKDWKESKMASIIVMRRHVGGHITAGIYLVDLLCLGIKDTFYLFNAPEEEIQERFGSIDFFMEASYKLVHNIIFAGHDFAMEFDIHPHKEFATTRFILEEDNDAIPLVDIEVGDKDGKPHLMVQESNRFPEALAKLKKNAGEGNYHYTIGLDMNEDDYELVEDEEEDEEFDEEEEEEDDDSAELNLDDVPVGDLNLRKVQQIKMEDLFNIENVLQRKDFEQILIRNEVYLYTLPDELEDLTDEEEDMWEEERELLEESAPLPNGVTEEQIQECERVIRELFDALGPEANSDREAIGDIYEASMKKALDAYPSNPLLVSEVYETSTLLFMDDCREKAMHYANKLYDKYPSVQLSLALGSLVRDNHMDPRFERIYREKDISQALPGYDGYFSFEILNFWLVKLWMSLEEDNLKDAVQYMYLIREGGVDLRFLLPVVIRLNIKLTEYYETNVLHLKTEEDDDEFDENEDNDENDENDKNPDQNTGGKVIPF